MSTLDIRHIRKELLVSFLLWREEYSQLVSGKKYLSSNLCLKKRCVSVCVLIEKLRSLFLFLARTWLVGLMRARHQYLHTHTHYNLFVQIAKCICHIWKMQSFYIYNFTYVTTTTPLVCCLSLPLFQRMCVMANLKAEYLCNIP